MKIKPTKIEDNKTNVPVNSSCHRIDQIKAEIAESVADPCKVPVCDMWDELRSNS